MSQTVSLRWQPLESLGARFRANLGALESRDPALANRLRELSVSRPFFIAAAGDNVYLGRPGPSEIEVIGDPVPPASARTLAGRVFPGGAITGPLAVSGLGYGWLWDCLSKLPSRVDVLPNHRPPIYFLAGDVEQLWAVLHVMDWGAMLADRRYCIFAGPNALEQFHDCLVADPTSPLPRGLVRIDSSLPPCELDAFAGTLRGTRDAQLANLQMRLEAVYATRVGRDWKEKFRSGRLRVLGITSRYTTFLQHSMRDWLAAFEQMGHDVRLVIEEHDHQMLGTFGYARGVLEYQPDLIVVIDHYRSELGKLPESIPCVMWVQDRMPHIYSAAGGAAQGPRDYCLGFGRLHLSSRYGYPTDRFLACTVGVNERRFQNDQLGDSDLAPFRCDVSYVSHASVPAEVLVQRFLATTTSPEISRVITDVHERMVAHFANGGQVLTDPVLTRHLADAADRVRFQLDPSELKSAVEFFGQQVNNALFRHQALVWVSESGADLRLYGRGWEAHPRLARHAKGEADNVHHLPRIYRASRINLQLIPHGAVHQRMLDGLAAGGFFLMRYTPGDDLGPPYRALWNWCQQRGIRDDREMRARADDVARSAIARIEALVGYDTSILDTKLFDCVETLADNDFASLASGTWPDTYPQVAFKTEADLRQMMERYLGDEDLRRQTAASMRGVVIDRFSYQSISQRLIRLIADTLEIQSAPGELVRARAA